jgi:adenosine deaminase CECR1
VSINKLRSQAKNIEEFDKSLESSFNLYTKQPEIDYPDGKVFIRFRKKVCNEILQFSVNTVWKRFQNMFTTVNGIFSYVPTYKAYHRRLLEELYEDNVMYLEMRTGLSGVKTYKTFN